MSFSSNERENMSKLQGSMSSVRDILLILSRIKIYDLGKQEILGEIPKKARELVQDLKINLDILRKK